MTTGNDPVLPDPQDQPTPTNPIETAVAAVAAEGTQPGEGEPKPGLTFTAPIEEVDPDDITLREATAAAQAEENGAGANPQGGQVQDPAKAGDPTAAQGLSPQEQQPQGQQHPMPMIPKPRLDHALSERDQARRNEAYWRGVAEARGQVSQPQPGQPGQQPQQPAALTPEQRLDAIKTQRKELAVKFDAGELTAADWEDKRSALDDQAALIREDALAAKLKPATPAPAQSNDLYLSDKTAEIEQTHPWSVALTELADKTGSEAEWNFLSLKARENLAGRGVDLKKGGDYARLELRREVAQLCTQYGPMLLTAQRAAELGIRLPGSQQPTQGHQQAPLSPAAKARQAALAKAAGAPPDLAAMTGHPGDPTGMIDEARAETLSEDDFDKLPIATKNKLLGITA